MKYDETTRRSPPPSVFLEVEGDLLPSCRRRNSCHSSAPVDLSLACDRRQAGDLSGRGAGGAAWVVNVSQVGQGEDIGYTEDQLS